MKFKHHLSRWN